MARLVRKGNSSAPKRVHCYEAVGTVALDFNGPAANDSPEELAYHEIQAEKHEG
jgi:hypothetical protein